MKGFKYLFKNIGLLAIGQFGTKLLAFFLVPLYTSVLTAEEYGTYDLFNSTVNLLIPILTLNLADSVLRFSLDKNKDKKDILSISIKYAFIGGGLFFAFAIMNHILSIFQTIDLYWYFLPIVFITTVLNTNLTYFARGLDKVKATAISGILCSAVMIILNIYFLLYLKIGLMGYFLANIIGISVQLFYLFVDCKCWKYIGLKVNHKLEKEMKNFCLPLIANNLAWWVNNSSDRYIVTFFCGVAANGIYSVGYKIPTILNIFQSIFNQAWTLSAVKDFDPEDEDGFFTKMYNIYNAGMVIICSVLIISARIIAKFLYAKDFFLAWKYVPFLLIAIVFGSLSGYLGGVFSAVKDSKIFAQSTVVGAIVNTLLNIILILYFGPIGVAVATMVSFWLVWVIRLKHTKKYIKINMNLKRDYCAYFLLIIQSILLFVFPMETIILYAIQIFILLVIFALFNKEIRGIVNTLLRKFVKR